MKQVLLTMAAVLCWQSFANATWSVIAVDRSTGQVIIASATCVRQSRFPPRPSRDLMDVQAVIVPGIGVAACQAGVDNTRENQMIVYEELKKGTDPARIIELLREHENKKDKPLMERRQFGIVDLQGRSAGFNGENNNNEPWGSPEDKSSNGSKKKSSNLNIDSIFVMNILKKSFPKYKIPRIINIVDNIYTTKTGKIKR